MSEFLSTTAIIFFNSSSLALSKSCLEVVLMLLIITPSSRSGLCYSAIISVSSASLLSSVTVAIIYPLFSV